MKRDTAKRLQVCWLVISRNNLFRIHKELACVVIALYDKHLVLMYGISALCIKINQICLNDTDKYHKHMIYKVKGVPKMKKYLCPCGYEYDPAVGDPDNGIAPGTAFEDLPDDWVCPVCGLDKSAFEAE